MESTAHGVINRALLGNRQGRGIGRVSGIGGLDKGPRLRVDQGCVIHGTSLFAAVLQMAKQKQRARTDPARAHFKTRLALAQRDVDRRFAAIPAGFDVEVNGLAVFQPAQTSAL